MRHFMNFLNRTRPMPASLAAAMMLAGGLAVGASTGATCTPAESRSVFTVIQTVCQAEILATSVIPTGTPVATVAADIEQACNMIDAQLSAIEQVVTQWETDQAASGNAPMGQYVPSPKVHHKAAK
jgi:hypothetical protein